MESVGIKAIDALPIRDTIITTSFGRYSNLLTGAESVLVQLLSTPLAFSSVNLIMVNLITKQFFAGVTSQCLLPVCKFNVRQRPVLPTLPGMTITEVFGHHVAS